MTQIRPLDRTAVLLILLFCFGLGINQIATKLALAEIPPMIQAAIRSVGATAMIGLYAWWKEPGIFRIDGTELPGIVIGLTFGIEFLALFIGLQYTTASHGILFLYSAPFFLALGMYFFVPQERLSRLQWLGLVTSFAGVALALRVSSQMSMTMLFGDLLCVLAAAFWGATTIVMKSTSLRTAPATKVLLYQLAVSAVFFIIAAIVRGEPLPKSVSGFVLANMAYQTFWVAGLMFLIWMWLIARYRAAELSAFTFLTPVLGVAAGWLVMDDPITPSFLVALVFVATGILLVNWPAKKAA